ncbi:MAG: heme ABC transporter permease [Alphaproteobacteria bacterium]|nr:heme ABC transporter permease [Alphaproteobacteria bacterium]
MIKAHSYLQPNHLLTHATRWRLWIGRLTLCLFAIGLYLAFIGSPPDYQQGETVRIMYVHVPCAWMAMGIYSFIAILSAIFLIWKYPLACILARSAAPLGALFTFLSLLTGALWGKPMWGTWWVWDARLTSVLILLFLYLGYLAISEAFEDTQTSLNAASVLAVVGFINVPIIKWSVVWWTTLHQPASITRIAAPAIHISMLIPLMAMALAFIGYFIWVLLLRVQIQLISAKTHALQLKLIHQPFKKTT